MEKSEMENIKVGDLFYTSWGYDQTNYDFIMVVEVSKTGKTAICKQAMRETVDNSLTCDKQVPTTETIGDAFRMKIVDGWSGAGKQLRGTYCKTWGEKTQKFRRDTFSKHLEGSQHWQTNSMFGH